MANPRSLNLPASGTSTQQYELAPGLAQYVQSVYVEVDNSAGAAARPTLTVSEQSGVVIAKKRQGESITAAGSGSATWALRLNDEAAATGGGGIDFDQDNVGDWLVVRTTGEATSPPASTTHVGIELQSAQDIWLESQSRDIHMTGRDILANNSGQILFAPSGAIILNGASLNAFTGTIGLGATGNLTLSGLLMIMAPSTDFRVSLFTGKKFEVRNHLGNPIFRVNEDGSLQGKTGQALTFNL